MGYLARAFAIIVVACILLPSEAIARNIPVRLSPLRWEVELEYRGLRSDREGVASSQSDLYTEKIELRQSGYIVNPKIVDFSISFTPTFSQQILTGGSEETGTFLDYEIDLRALEGAEAPVYFGADASRNTGSFSNNLGSRTDVTREIRGLNMGWKLAAFPMTLRYEEQLSEQTVRTGSTSIPRYRDEFQQSVQWQARSSKLNAKVERRWFDDRIGENDYESLQQSINHILRWGKGSYLSTRQDYHNREGRHSFKRQIFSETMRLQHLDNLRSDFDYGYSSVTQDGITRTHNGSYGLNYRPTENLNAVLTAQGRDREFETGLERIYGGGLGLSYRKGVFGSGRLSVGFNGSSLQTDRRSNGTTYESLDVSYTVPATLLVLLSTRAIVTDSIFVTDLAASQVFLEGVDYIIRTLSGDRTELQILTTGLISAGDTILVSYRAAAQPSAEFNTGSVHADIALDFDWLRLYHSSKFTEETLQSGSFGEGQNDLRDQTTGVELKWSETWFEASGRAEAHSYESGDFSTESVSFTETARVELPVRAFLVLSASQISSESDGRQTDLSQWDINVSWEPLRGMSVKPYVSGWERQEDFGRDEERLGAGVNFSWRLRKFSLDLDFSHLEHVIGKSDRAEQRLLIRIVRRSR